MNLLNKITAVSAVFALALAPAASAQIVTEVGAMTVTNEVFDGDLLAAQPTVVTLTDVNNATLSGNSLNLANITLTPSTAALGLQSTNIYGAALALDPAGSGSMMSAALNESFQAFNASVDLSGASTEFGLAVADWVGPMIMDFYSGGFLVFSMTSSTYTNPGTEETKYFQMTGGTFDRVDIQASVAAGNWSIPAMAVESVGPVGPSLTSNGTAPAVITFDFANFGAGEQIAVVYGPAGTFTGNTPCGSVTASLIPLNPTPAQGLILLVADGAGNAQLVQNVPAAGSGLLVQALALTSCDLTNTVTL